MNEHFFGEWVEYRDEEEKKEAHIYLDSWVKFFVRKLPNMQLGETKIVDRPIIESVDGSKQNKSTLGVKIQMIGEKPDYVLTLSK